MEDDPRPFGTHMPSSAFTAGLPGPPRLLVPPPVVNGHDSFPSFYSHSFASLDALVTEALLPRDANDWKYESRREAQRVLPHLYLGPLKASRDIGFIRREGITQIIGVRTNAAAKARILGDPNIPDVKMTSLDINGTSDLIRIFQTATDIIDSHYLNELSKSDKLFQQVLGVLSNPIDGRQLLKLQERLLVETGKAFIGGKTLLFCESGNEKSATVVAGYIMQHLQATAVQSIQYVQGRRFCVCFDDQSKWLLQSYEPIWTARRVAGPIGGGSVAPANGGNARRKRGYEEHFEGEDMDTTDNPQPRGNAPFTENSGGNCGDIDMDFALA